VFHPAEYLQRAPRGRGLIFTLNAREELGGIRLEMAASGSISGRILDKEGRGVGYARVLALEAVYVHGLRVLNIAQTVQSNDRGEYRLFWLPPGEYYVAARPGSLERRMVPLTIVPPGYGATSEEAISPVIVRRMLDDGTIVEETYPLTYYGGATDPGKAMALTLRSGGVASAVDIPLAGLVRTHRIRGRVTVEGTGQSFTSASVRAIPVDRGPQIVVPTAISDGMGNFEISGAVPGAYLIFAAANTAFNPLSPDGLTGWTRVEVGAVNLEGAAIVVRRGFELSGRIETEGRTSDTDLTRIRIGLRREPDILGMPASLPIPAVPSAVGAGLTSADGTFTLRAISPGQYVITVASIPEGSYLKSIRMREQDLLGVTFRIDSQPEQLLTIVVASDGASIDGQVLNDRRTPVANAVVALIPDVPLRQRRDLYRTFATDMEGRFRARAVAPGRYTVLAWESVEDGRWEDPEFLRLQQGRGTEILLDANDKETVVVEAIRANP
jgi:hypothetical protein